MTTDLNTLLTALYVKIDDWLGSPPRCGRPPKFTDAELLTVAVAQVLLRFSSEARWLRFVRRQLPGAFRSLPQQSGYNKRLRAAVPLLKRVIRALARDTDLWSDATWIVDSTPVECARSREAARRSDLAGWAGYGYCSSHSRFFWGLRLHLITTPAWAAAMLAHQGQLHQRPDRAFGTQHRITQVEQRIRPPSQTPVELLPKPRQIPDWTSQPTAMHTDHRSP